MIYDLPTHTVTAPVLSTLNGISIMDLLKYRKDMMVFKLVSDVSKRNTAYVDRTKLYLATGKHLNVLQPVLPTEEQKCGITFPTIFITMNRCFQICICKMVF